jgi:hypothetical protein
MTPALIAAISTAAVAIIGALTSLIIAFRANGKSADAQKSAGAAVAGVAAGRLTEAQKAEAAAGRDAVLTVPCDACNAPAGARCTLGDQPTNLVHKTRVASWRNQQGLNGP